MEKRVTYYVSPKSALTWLAAVLTAGSVGLRIAYLCGKGADATTMWMLFILPVAASLIFVLQILLDGREHFYRTLLPVIGMIVYFTSVLVLAGLNRWWILLSVLLYLASTERRRLMSVLSALSGLLLASLGQSTS